MFYLDNDLTELRDGIAESMSRGLHTKDASTIKMLPSFVENLPSKDGNSTYVALDLGGTNFRVLLINIVDGQDISFSHACLFNRVEKIYRTCFDI